MIEQPTIYTSRWANRDLAHLDAQPVGISRGVPRFPTGYKYRLVRELAPDDAAWNAPDWKSFEEAYRRQLKALGVEAIVSRLARISEEAGGVAVVALCYEQDPCDCHRGTLSSWLRKHGVEIRELRAGDVGKRPDTPQPSLFDDEKEQSA